MIRRKAASRVGLCGVSIEGEGLAAAAAKIDLFLGQERQGSFIHPKPGTG